MIVLGLAWCHESLRFSDRSSSNSLADRDPAVAGQEDVLFFGGGAIC
ncbi:hypothetical protein NC99_01270 [Sunxiuqinia dokdonensis]|uniref:Uncharacterized protein n=1 Tax=Sunxiuqinia dokdonensis TaxID=1409788 RepID=A0A0L8VF46_9BACT|nr:hypothetical protein NC99_01270 [Sunxiuqinia dokdonensis]